MSKPCIIVVWYVKGTETSSSMLMEKAWFLGVTSTSDWCWVPSFFPRFLGSFSWHPWLATTHLFTQTICSISSFPSLDKRNVFASASFYLKFLPFLKGLSIIQSTLLVSASIGEIRVFSEEPTYGLSAAHIM